MKENLIKAIVIFGGGFLLFMLLKPKDPVTTLASIPTTPTKPISFSGDTLDAVDAPKPNLENAGIVADAYLAALIASESPAALAELNKECMAEFGMKAYIDAKKDKLIVCDKSGNTIIERDN